MPVTRWIGGWPGLIANLEVLTCICLMAGGLLVKTWRQSVTRRDVRYVPKRDVRALHDMTSDMSQNVTSERYTMWRQICPKTWRQSVTRHDVRYVPKRDVRALHDVTSDMSHVRQDVVTWLLHANAHPALRISQYENLHPVWCFWILLEFRNTIVRVSGHV